MIRLFISEATPDWAPGLSLTLNQDQSRYLASVMRLGVGDKVLAFNGRDGEWLCRVSVIAKRYVTLDLVTMIRPQPIAQGPILAIALVKRAALETIIEKATELGVSAIQPVITARCNSQHTNIERLVLIAKEASEQTERLDVPHVHSPVKLEHWLRERAASAIVFADEGSALQAEDWPSTEDVAGRGPHRTPPALKLLGRLAVDSKHAIASTAVLIGPEGGFDDGERQALRALPDVYPVNLGPRILRADTAAISALTLVQSVLGDWQ